MLWFYLLLSGASCAHAEHEANPIQYAQDHKAHVLVWWRDNQDKVAGTYLPLPIRFREAFRTITSEAYQGTALEGLHPSFWIGFLADKNRTEDTGSCQRDGNIPSTLIHEIGWFNIPAGPSIICENESARDYFFGRRAEGDDMNIDFDADRFSEHRERLCSVEAERAAHPIDPLAPAETETRARRHRGISEGCRMTQAPVQQPYPNSENLYVQLARDPRVHRTLIRVAGRPPMPGTTDQLNINTSPISAVWRSFSSEGMHDQLAIGIVSLLHYADLTASQIHRYPTLRPRRIGSATLSDRDLGWMATLGLLGWSSGMHLGPHFISELHRPLVEAARTPTSPLWAAWVKGACREIIRRCTPEFERALVARRRSGTAAGMDRQVSCSRFPRLDKQRFPYRMLRIAQRLETSREVAMDEHAHGIDYTFKPFMDRAIGTREELTRAYSILTRAAYGLTFHISHRSELSCD